MIIFNDLNRLDWFLLCSVKHCSQLVGQALWFLTCKHVLVCYLCSSYLLIFSLLIIFSVQHPANSCSCHVHYDLIHRQTLWTQKSHLYLLCLLNLPSGVDILQYYLVRFGSSFSHTCGRLPGDTNDSLVSFCSFASSASSHWMLMKLRWPKWRVWGARVCRIDVLYISVFLEGRLTVPLPSSSTQSIPCYYRFSSSLWSLDIEDVPGFYTQGTEMFFGIEWVNDPNCPLMLKML